MTKTIRAFGARIAALALAFASLIVGRVIGFLDTLPVSIDRTIGGLEKVVAKLDRAEAQQLAVADFEVSLQEASYDREDAAMTAAQRAARVRDRVKALLA